MDRRQINVGWCVASLSLDMASVRYRALLPLLALEAQGFICSLFTSRGPVNFESLDALVVVKAFSLESLALVQRARALDMPVIIDLCDNVFVPGYGKGPLGTHGEMFTRMAQLATAVVTTTEPLADVIRAHVPGVVVHVIPDGLASETVTDAGSKLIEDARAIEKSMASSLWRSRLKKLSNEFKDSGVIYTLKRLLEKQLQRVRKKRGRDGSVATVMAIAGALLRPFRKQMAGLKKAPVVAAPALRPVISDALPRDPSSTMYLLWFGNHGADYADFGMLDLLLIQDALEAIALEYPVELVVISNNAAKYERFIKPMAIASRYVEWSINVVDDWMAVSRVVLIPNSCDPFSVCKSANRTVHALTQGIPVVATATPALSPLAGSIMTGDFLQGLRRYLSSTENGRKDIALARTLIEQHFSSAVIGSLWRDALQSVIAQGSGAADVHEAEVLVVLHLVQDLDLALPIILELKQREIAVQVVCSHALLKASPRVMKTLSLHQINVRVVSAAEPLSSFRFGSRTRALLTVSETNLSPHLFSRTLTEAAKAAGIMTATLQHGLENVGLTYSDEIHSIDRINFAADRIYLWGGLDTLHADISAATRAKCVAIGCSKVGRDERADLDALIAPEACVIGVFENLHWHRYSEEYRQFFLEGVTALAEQFPSVTFLIKPHHAGLWLTSRYKGDKPVGSNLIIADPKQAEWERYTAGGLLGRMKAVITSPSTVALDAAARGLPVAVVKGDLDTETYAPLYTIEQMANWSAFIERVLDESQAPELKHLSECFVNRMVLEGDAAARLVDDLLSTSILNEVSS
ncbi:glycosyltransferase [Pseudomonas sp. B21-015]|uniref:glycosyltransferase n=1 Tax=Pseudomonas sp. B21-015 TaxID=2895473 RepID=UPI0021600FC6|nr:glycosyltransferase [Pseudomonas sp. B21-015]UVM52147.1 glycosyltransferase [Pseudomonas sp. B21-015]